MNDRSWPKTDIEEDRASDLTDGRRVMECGDSWECPLMEGGCKDRAVLPHFVRWNGLRTRHGNRPRVHRS